MFSNATEVALETARVVLISLSLLFMNSLAIGAVCKGNWRGALMIYSFTVYFLLALNVVYAASLISTGRVDKIKEF